MTIAPGLFIEDLAVGQTARVCTVGRGSLSEKSRGTTSPPTGAYSMGSMS